MTKASRANLPSDTEEPEKAAPKAAAPYKPTGYDPAVDPADPTAVVTVLQYINNKLADIRRVAYRFEKMMNEGRLLTQDDAIQIAKSWFIIEHGQELDDVLIARGAAPLTQQMVDKAIPGGQKHEAKPPPGPFDENPEAGAPKCPKCGRGMQRRVRKSDSQPFWGCPGYFVKDADGNPSCRQILPITATAAADVDNPLVDKEEDPASVPGTTNLF